MAQVSLAEAKAKFSALVERAMKGETVEVTRRGKPVVRIVASEPVREPFDFNELKRLTDSMNGPVIDSEAFWREFREDTRY